NALGVCSALIFPFCIGLLLTAGKRQRILLFSCALLSTVVVILARSRAGVLGIMLFLLGFALWQWRMTETDEARKRLKLHILWAFGALCLLLVIILVVQDIAGLAQMPLIGDALLVVAHPSEDSLTYVLRHRLHQWSEALRMCRQFPLTGVGLGAYIIELPNFYAVNKGQMFIIDTAGNLFLQVASELGFMGLLLLLCFGIVVLENVFNSFRVCIHRAYSAGRELLGCVGLGILVASFLFLFGAHTVFFEYNYLMAISVAVLLAWKTHPIEAQDSHSKARARSIIHRSFVAVPVIIVMGIFLVQSLGPLSIEQRRQDVGWQFEYGLYRKELWDNRFPFWWTQQESQMRVPVQGSILAFSVFCAHPDADERPVVCRVSIDGQMRGRAELTRDRWRRLKVPVNAPIGSEIVFNVAVDRTFCPCVEDNTADDRDLGVAIANIRWSD
ncbi:O-antigen ligase family protein, partial [bacterium]|nr:O-antigen ligase family protein [bacterium]